MHTLPYNLKFLALQDSVRIFLLAGFSAKIVDKWKRLKQHNNISNTAEGSKLQRWSRFGFQRAGAIIAAINLNVHTDLPQLITVLPGLHTLHFPAPLVSYLFSTQ